VGAWWQWRGCRGGAASRCGLRWLGGGRDGRCGDLGCVRWSLRLGDERGVRFVEPQRALLRGKALSLGERWLRDRLHSPIPRSDQPIHMPENLDLDPDVTKNVDLIMQQVEAGSNAKVGPWTINVSAERIDISGNGSMPGDQVKALVLGNIYIPEPVLIALAAIEEYEPSWILKEDLFRENVVPASTNAKESMFARTLKEHQSNFPDWHNLEQYRRSYLGLCSELSQD